MTPQELKNSILQRAIQGRLVEQRLEEGTGEELFLQVQNVKNKLISDGKLKKEKKTYGLTDEDCPFDIPESWKWVTFSDLFDIGSAIRIHQTDWKTEGIPFFRGRELVRLAKTGDPDAEIFISEELYEQNKAKGGVPQKGDLLITAVGTLGKVYIVKGTHPFYFKDAYILRYNNYAKLYSDYYKYVIESPFIQGFIAQGSMGTTVAQLTIQKAKRMVCPLPPLAEQKRIVDKVEELLPLIDRYEAAWIKLEDFNQRFPRDMQKSILQMAIQGKLVSQDPSEGTGEELYKQIQLERAKLIKDGKIKKEKEFTPIAENEKPYNIPDNWAWARFGNLGSYKKGPFGSALTKSMFVTKGPNAIKVYEQKNAIQKDSTLGEYYITRDYFESKMVGFEVRPGDIIVSCAGTIGETYIMPDGIEQGIINQALMRMQIFKPMYIPYFLMFFDVVLKKNARSGSKGSAIKNIPPFEILKNYLVPIPPLAEQKRIVLKLEELLSLCERLK